MNSIHSTGAGKDEPVHFSAADNDAAFEFWRFKDLVERRIVTDRADLFRKQQRGFPHSVKFSKGQGAVALFPKAAVKAWLVANMSSASTDAGN